MRLSVSVISVGLFLAFILHSIWNLVGIFRVPTCTKGEKCYISYLNTNPNLDLLLFVSDNSRSGNVEQVFSLEKFDYNSRIEKEIPIQLSKTVRNNGSLYVHTIVIPSNSRKRDYTLNDLINQQEATYLKYSLTQYTIPASATFNLLKEESKKQNVKPVTHLRSKFSVIMCTDKFELSSSNIPVEIIRHLRINYRKQFLPIIQRDIMQMRLRDLVEVTKDMREATILFTYTPVSIGKIRFVSQIDSTLHQFIALGFTEKDLDEVKGVFADTNLYLLCATVLIGSIHLLLDFLSFKNDVKFWKAQTSMAGLSTSSVLWRAFSQTVIFLYLLDEGTSLLVLIPSGIATIIEFWKVSKVLKKSIKWDGGLKFSKGEEESAEELQTRKYDEECMKYLCYLLYPLCAGAAIYSLLYQPHKSWYSWTINSLVNGVYAFGFLFMLPQLFINYRLKSVAALPWRAFTYRAFNTFIDDIFAFIITMPTAHRVACFRDDVVFLIYLYQRWLYPVDKTRIDDVTSETILSEDESKKNN
ncbi:lipid scramblase CLPTM1L [Tribolium castaneum]|uniref:Lipid scramblase CLPTM1L n=1 Tax=Tribolium castaneum TaxID=7070 RepID=D6WFQ7_TRICA|nr:PREDICTED: cleft lip and palate transmembrane protein 1-like protein [Tribolium castaneum]XP_008200070.1 PREDICTED: cleft lip and palate transmembrane protein 1-like protein [Tribolium castaneum]EEZ99580.1 Cleft lip and palate transmembrane protein 1-like protein [Tribolium castaneum]|eukprot:XP_008200069.1 PREDICTED: cleft lip and palate transmembrane protein 1-like protein [Tribolium castaneum]